VDHGESKGALRAYSLKLEITPRHHTSPVGCSTAYVFRNLSCGDIQFGGPWPLSHHLVITPRREQEAPSSPSSHNENTKPIPIITAPSDHPHALHNNHKGKPEDYELGLNTNLVLHNLVLHLNNLVSHLGVRRSLFLKHSSLSMVEPCSRKIGFGKAGKLQFCIDEDCTFYALVLNLQ
jgi:hypothetical protein